MHGDTRPSCLPTSGPPVLAAAILDDVTVTPTGEVLVAGHLAGWVRRHPGGWTAIVAGTPDWVPPTATLPAVIDRLLRHPDRPGPLILEHLGPSAATVLLARCVGPGQHTGPIGEEMPP